MNCHQILRKANKFLKTNSLKNSNLDSELLLSKVLKKKREKILINLNDTLNPKQIKKFNSLIFRRKNKEPIAQILGFKYFWKYKFVVDKTVLTPRPETEHIIEEALKIIPFKKTLNLLDIGTGSGCIIISILKERTKCRGTAIDISNKALKIAKTNAKLHQLENKIKFININIDKFGTNKYDLILSNPPYINNVDYGRLEDDVRLFEPRPALSGGLDGFRELKKIIKKSSVLLKENGNLIIEIGDNQKNHSVRILKKNGFYIRKICKDLSGKDRCIISKKINK